MNPSRRIDVVVDDYRLSGVGIRRYRPEIEPKSWLVWFHGGGWVYGEPAGDDPLLTELAAATGVGIVSIDYPLAPEHPYPAAIDEVMDLLAVSQRNTPVYFGGASAGGALAIGSALRTRGTPLAPDGLLLVCPAIDDRARADSSGRLTRTAMDQFWSAYLGLSKPDEFYAPGRAESTRGLPRTYIFTTSNDPLRHEAWSFAARLASDDVAVEVQHVPGGFHGFEYEAPEAQFTHDAISRWVQVLNDWTATVDKLSGEPAPGSLLADPLPNTAGE